MSRVTRLRICQWHDHGEIEICYGGSFSDTTHSLVLGFFGTI